MIAARATSLAAGAVLAAIFASPAAAQIQAEGGGQALAALVHLQSNSTAPAPRGPDGKPDLTGLWGPDKTFMYDLSSGLSAGETLPLQPWASKAAAERMSREDPAVACLPMGVPRQSPYPWKIVQTPKLIVLLYEGNTHSYRQVFMDGRSHPSDLDASWMGDSTGKWEGDTLVVDTIGFNDKSWLDEVAHPHTAKLHTIERYHRTDLGHMQIDVTIDDSGAYTKPFTVHGHSALLVNAEIMEYLCNENNVDAPHIVGKDNRK
jgi:hypothetical protein